MKSNKVILVILVLMTSTCIFAQKERATYKSVINEFINYYNNDQPDSVFFLFSIEMQEALPIDQTYHFVEGLQQQLGNIISTEFIRYQSTMAIYKTEFNQGVLALHISIDDLSKINGLLFKPYVPDNLPLMERNETKLVLPFDGGWYVLWGGDTKKDNYHVAVQAQKNAFDFVIKDKEGKTYKNDGQSNEDYYCFGKNIYAPCDAQVVLVVDGIKDNKPGEMNSYFAPGNTVVLKTIKDEFIYLCHFKKHSIKVEEGQEVKQGNLLGLCGNSGNSSEAHLHYHIQNVENINIATGVKCYFKKILVNNSIKQDYSPIKNEIVSNIGAK